MSKKDQEAIKIVDDMSLKIEHVHCDDFDLIYQDYINDFPPVERLSYQEITNHLKCDEYHLLFLKDQEILSYILGYSKDQKFFWIDFFAVLEKHRSKSYGSKFIKKMLDEYKTLVFEVEVNDGIKNSIKDRRERFYLNLGAKRVDIPYELVTKEGSLEMNLFVISSRPYDKTELKNFIIEAVSFIHKEKKHTLNVIKKYISCI